MSSSFLQIIPTDHASILGKKDLQCECSQFINTRVVGRWWVDQAAAHVKHSTVVLYLFDDKTLTDTTFKSVYELITSIIIIMQAYFERLSRPDNGSYLVAFPNWSSWSCWPVVGELLSLGMTSYLVFGRPPACF